jgi:hypothetical protein
MAAATTVAHINRGYLAEIPMLAPVGDLGVCNDSSPTRAETRVLDELLRPTRTRTNSVADGEGHDLFNCRRLDYSADT